MSMKAMAMTAAALSVIGMSDMPFLGKKAKKPLKNRGYTRVQRKEIEHLKLDRSSPGRKKLKQYYKMIHEGIADE
jgi:hypothetical protein